MSVLVGMTVYLWPVSQLSLMQSNETDIQLDNVRMPQELQILNFALHTTDHVSGQQFPARDDLEGDLAAAGLVDGQLDLPKGPFAQHLDRLVLVEPLHVSHGGRRLGGRLPASSIGARRRRHRHGGRSRAGQGGRGTITVSVAVAVSVVAVGREGDEEVFVVEGSGHGDGSDVR